MTAGVGNRSYNKGDARAPAEGEAAHNARDDGERA